MVEITEKMAAAVLGVVDEGLSIGLGSPIPGEMCIEAAVCFALGEGHSDMPTCVSPVLRQFKIGLNDASWSSNAARAAGLRRIAIAQLGTADAFDEQLFVNKLNKVTITKLLPKVLRSAGAMQEEPHKSILLEAAKQCETEGSAADDDASAARARTAAHARAAARAADAATAAYARAAAARAADAASATAIAADAAASAAYAASASTATAAAYAADAARTAAHVSTAADQLLGDFAEQVVQILVEMETPGSKFLFLTFDPQK